MAKPIKQQFGPTQKDIARELGISQATVAYALSKEKRDHRIPKETVEKIHAKAEELGYRSQRHAQILRKGRSHIIGVAFLSASYHAPQERVSYLAQGAIRAGYQLVAVDLQWFQFDERAAQNYLMDASVEGVIFCNIFRETEANSWANFLKQRKLPAVALSSSVGGEIDEVFADLRGGFREITEHHLKNGSQTLDLLLPMSSESLRLGVSPRSLAERAHGFGEAILAAGGTLNATPEAIATFGAPYSKKARHSKLVGNIRFPIIIEDGGDAYDAGYQEAERRICTGDLPDSLICSNDQLACGVLSACLQRGVAVPDRVRISGMDNAPYARYNGTPITTISQPSEAMTQCAIQRIVELIENPAERGHIQKRAFPCEMIFRASTQPLLSK